MKATEMKACQMKAEGAWKEKSCLFSTVPSSLWSLLFPCSHAIMKTNRWSLAAGKREEWRPNWQKKERRRKMTEKEKYLFYVWERKGKEGRKNIMKEGRKMKGRRRKAWDNEGRKEEGKPSFIMAAIGSLLCCSLSTMVSENITWI